jgi:hypothetical protein
MPQLSEQVDTFGVGTHNVLEHTDVLGIVQKHLPRYGVPPPVKVDVGLK